MRFWLAYLAYYWGGVHRYFAISNGVMAEFGRAAVWFERALKIEPDFLDARYALAAVLGRELGRPQEGIVHLNKILASDPRDGDALLMRAQCRQELGHQEGALGDWEAYLALPDQPHHDIAKRMVALLREAQE